MAEEITYYAIVNEDSSRDRPAGVLRRITDDDEERDEAFGIDLTWSSTSLMYSYERGDLQNDFIPITEEEAERIVERIRRLAESGQPM